MEKDITEELKNCFLKYLDSCFSKDSNLLSVWNNYTIYLVEKNVTNNTTNVIVNASMSIQFHLNNDREIILTVINSSNN